jgi:hypothetical protein
VSSEPRAPWERRDGETVKAYAAFTAFAELPPKERSIAAAYRAQSGRGSGASAPGYWRDWARLNEWEERAAARDRHLAREALEALTEERRTFARAVTTASRLALAKTMERLNGLDPADLTVSEATRLMEVADRLYRMAFAELVALQRADDEADDPLEQLRGQLVERAAAGDLKAAEVLVRLEERLAKARGTDPPDRHLLGIEHAIADLSDGVALANLSAETRQRVLAELAPDAGAEADTLPT